MSKNSRRTTRQPATTHPKLRKKMQKAKTHTKAVKKGKK